MNTTLSVAPLTESPDVTSARSFEAVLQVELGVLYRVAMRMCRNGTEAEDLVGQTLLSAAKGWAKFDGRHPRSWLITILRNEHIMAARRAASRPQTIGFDAPELPELGGQNLADEGPLDEALSRAGEREILAAVDELPEEFRLAVALCDVEELSYAEAATALSVPIGTIRSRVFRGRRLLRDKLRHLEPSCNL